MEMVTSEKDGFNDLQRKNVDLLVKNVYNQNKNNWQEKYMKKIIKIAVCSLSCIFLIGCSQDKKYSMEDFDNYVKIGSYKHIIEIDDRDKDFSEEKVLDNLNVYLDIWNDNTSENYSGNIENGLDVSVSYSIDDSEEMNSIITIGEDMIAPGIDELLVGHKTGYILDTEIETDSGRKKLNVVTHYIVKKNVQEEVTDEFISDITGGKLTSVDAYKDYICNEYAENIKIAYGQQVLSSVTRNAQFRDIDGFVEEEYKKLYDDFKKEAETSGISTKDMYTEYGYKNKKTFEESLHNIAEYNVKQCLIIYKFTDLFDEKVTDEDITSYKGLQENAINQEYMDHREENLETYILYRKIMKRLYEAQL